ncbi:MAG: hypothetical protein ACXAAO_08900 [Candidatus Thorarchaeota archaeon]
MRLPVCNFDLESDMLCTNCQARLDRGELKHFDIEISKWLLERDKSYPSLEDFTLLRAAKIGEKIVLVVKKRGKSLILAEEALIAEITEHFGEPIIVEGPVKLRRVISDFISPAKEVGVNSLYLPDGSKESIVMLRAEDKERLSYSVDELRLIVSAVMGESVLFEFQDDRVKPEKEDEVPDEFDQRMEEMGKRSY